MADRKARTLLMIYATRNEITRHKAFPGSLRDTPTMDGGSAEIAGANFCPYFLYICAPPSLAPCAIPPVHGHKKSPLEEGFLRIGL